MWQKIISKIKKHDKLGETLITNHKGLQITDKAVISLIYRKSPIRNQ